VAFRNPGIIQTGTTQNMLWTDFQVNTKELYNSVVHIPCTSTSLVLAA
jgi:hypothetical protein